MSRMIRDGDTRYGKCPFCGLNRQFVTVEYKERIEYVLRDGAKAPAVEAIIHCQKCGAMMENQAPSEDEAVQGAIDKWRMRA